MTDVDRWPLPPLMAELSQGQLIRERKVVMPPMTSRPVRPGGAEPKVIVAETREFVVYRVWSSKGEDLGERVLSKAEFDETYERGFTVQYVDTGKG